MWTQYPGSSMRISVGPAGVWAVNRANYVYKKTIDDWEHIEGSLKDISVGKNSIWGVNELGNLFKRSGQNEWQQIQPGK